MTHEKNFNRALGLRLMVQRQKLKLSQKDLGAQIGVSGQQMQKYENGVSSIPPHRLALCAQILKKPIGYFYGDGEDFTVAGNSNILRIAAEIDQLPYGAVETILDVVRNINKMKDELPSEKERA